MSEESKKQIEHEVVDQKAYKKYLKVCDFLENDPNRFFQTSDPDLKIDMVTVKNIVEKKITHLPTRERDLIKELNHEFRSKIREKAHLQKKAYGRNRLVPDKSIKTFGLGDADTKATKIMELFGRMFTLGEVAEQCQKWGYNVSIAQLAKFYEYNYQKIDELQKEFKSSPIDMRLTHRKGRVEELHWLYHTIKQKYEKNESREDAKIAAQLLEQIKKEIDGDLVINGKMEVDINATITQQVQQEAFKDFNITSLIIQRLAGKMDVNPLLILSRLANSVHAKFTGFKSPDVSMEADEPTYLSNFTYDLDRLEEMNKGQVEKENKLKPLPVVTGESKKESLSLKELMLQKLKEEKQNIQDIKGEVNAIKVVKQNRNKDGEEKSDRH